jgi:hypothetical protein
MTAEAPPVAIAGKADLFPTGSVSTWLSNENIP